MLILPYTTCLYTRTVVSTSTVITYPPSSEEFIPKLRVPTRLGLRTPSRRLPATKDKLQVLNPQWSVYNLYPKTTTIERAATLLYTLL
jgi:hypothetical protein